MPVEGVGSAAENECMFGLICRLKAEARIVLRQKENVLNNEIQTQLR